MIPCRGEGRLEGMTNSECIYKQVTLAAQTTTATTVIHLLSVPLEAEARILDDTSETNGSNKRQSRHGRT